MLDDGSLPYVADERLAELKKLRRGKGLWGWVGEEVETIVGYPRQEFLSGFETAVRLMPPWRSTDAILNALGVGHGTPATSLTVRREEFARQADVSVRTIIRWEEHGARLLLDYIDRVTASIDYPVWLLDTHYFLSVWFKQHAERIGLNPDVVENATTASYALWNERHYLPPDRQRIAPERDTLGRSAIHLEHGTHRIIARASDEP